MDEVCLKKLKWAFKNTENNEGTLNLIAFKEV